MWILLNIMSGSETTATMLSGITYYLCKNPNVLTKLTTEIRKAYAFEPEAVSQLPFQGLPYLNACIEESLRIFPLAHVSLPRIVPPGGATVCGDWLPGGTSVGVTPWAASHSQQNFKQAEDFIPERWLGGKEWENKNKKAAQAFSYGPRNCLGRK